MATDFYCPPGTVYRSGPKDSGSAPMFLIEPEIPSGDRAGIVILGAPQIQEEDIVAPVSCLENVKVYYQFGQSFGAATVSGEVMLGAAGSIRDNAGRIEEFFKENRVSVLKKPVKLSGLGGRQYFFFLERMQILPVIPEVHIMPFVFYGHILDQSSD